MRILEYGNINNSTIMLVHGFESPYQIWIDYIEHYKENYHILVPILPGHDVREKSEFNSFDDTAKEIENYCISKSINHIYAIYGMSMGGVVASYLWKNKRLTFEKVILESSPLLPFGKYMTQMLIKQYLSITQKARERNRKVVRNAINSMVTQERMRIFLAVIIRKKFSCEIIVTGTDFSTVGGVVVPKLLIKGKIRIKGSSHLTHLHFQ